MVLGALHLWQVYRHGIRGSCIANHYHMTDVKPGVIFLHYHGTGPAAKLAQGVRAAVDVLGRQQQVGSELRDRE